MTGTLICDEDGLYDPGNFNDRLLLGLGTLAAFLAGAVLGVALRSDTAALGLMQSVRHLLIP